MKLRPSPIHQARRAISEAIATYTDPSLAKAPVALVMDTAVATLETQGMAPDTAADLVERAWQAHFAITEAN